MEGEYGFEERFVGGLPLFLSSGKDVFELKEQCGRD